MGDEKIFLLEQANRCRRLARAIDDQDFARKLLAMAGEYEQRAATVPSPPLVPSGVPHMGKPIQKNIERRAYQLWEEAGQPEGKDLEFYLEAERQLTDELIRHELRTPDNL
jgi:hypothetical protein